MEARPRVVLTTEDLGMVLRAARRARSLTQQQAAELTGVGTRLWNEAERGKRNQLGLETALRMLHILGLDLVIEPRTQRRGGSSV